MNPDVAEMLRDLLLRQQIPVSDPNLVPLATLAARALAELNDELARAAQPADPPTSGDTSTGG